MRASLLLFAFALAGVANFPVLGQSTNNVSEFSNFSLEELINIEITSVGKKETPLLHSPAAIAVLTQDDVRRLGATSIPEALRAIPGVQVARISADRWAISARGFNDEYSNKLLVLVDGRSVYTPTYGGVYWSVQDLVLEDLDRIEVIRGPGATLWGANAVNGVINIITRSAKETQGTLVSTSFGTEDQPSISVRHGGKLSSNVFYRVYGKYFNREGFNDAQSHSMSDDWNMARTGARMDWEAGEQNTFTLQGDYYSGNFGEQAGKTSIFPPNFQTLNFQAPASGGNVLSRWTSRFSDESELKLQVYFDSYKRAHIFGGGTVLAGPDEFSRSHNLMVEHRDTGDVDLQHRFKLAERNDVVWGMGYRRTEDRNESKGVEIFWNRPRSDDDLFSAFLQDEITLVKERLWLTLGSKFEHNDYTGFEIQPAGRLLWTPEEHHTLWASVARAVRTPTRLERDSNINVDAVNGTPSVLISALGNPNATSEELLAYEMGYRVEPVRRLSLDATAFFNDYQLLATKAATGHLEMLPFPYWLQDFGYENDIRGHAYGTEFLAQWQATDFWRLTAGYSWMQTDFKTKPSISQAQPEHQAHLRSSVDLGRGWELNAAAYLVGRVKTLRQQSFGEPVTIGSYVRLDVGLSWKLNENLEFSFWGQNLLDEGHAEFASYKTPNIAEIPRSFFGKVTLRF